MKFEDKVVLVTGASSGIGRATAEAFAKEGSYVAITGRNQANLDEAEKACRKYGAKDVLPLNVDFAELVAVKTLAEKVVAKFKRLDILVNNAGTVGAIKNLHDETEENFDHLFTINVKSLLFLTQTAMPYLIESKGCVVNISSLGSVECAPHMITYGMTKAAVDYFTKTVALEYAPKGVRVNSVNPAVIRTNILDGVVGKDAAEKAFAASTKLHPIERIGTADEVAKAVLFLASDDCSWTTGHCFMVDGGRRLRTAN